jgi:hypothetical protein
MSNEDVNKDSTDQVGGVVSSETTEINLDDGFDSGGLFPTVELSPESSSEPALKAETDKDGQPVDKDDDSRENKRIRELNDRVKASEEKTAKLEADANKRARVQPKPQDQKPDFKVIEDMKADEVREWQEDDPAGFAANERKRSNWENSQQNAADNQEAAMQATYASHAKTHKSFSPMWDSGEIQDYMNQHPGHNAISAHMMLTSTKRTQKTVDEAVESALKKERETVDKDRRTRGGIGGLGAGPAKSGALPTNDAAMKDSRKFGGTTSVLLQRHQARVRSGQA